MDKLSAERRSANMRQIHSQNTAPELLLRRMLHKLGYRFRLHRRDLPGKPDLVFPARSKVMFVHGCFWHSHACKTGLIPNTTRSFWLPKLRRNKTRDGTNMKALAKLGWDALVIWQCELKNSATVRLRVKRFLGRAG